MPALFEAYRAGLLGRQHWLPNIIAGVIVGVVALPLAMAFAIASGAKPEQGLYTAIVAGLAAAMFGGSRLQVTGPTGAFIVILSGVTATYGIAGLQLATLMAGLMLIAMGLTRMGGLIRFIPTPVIVGFTAGIAIIIWVGQWQDFFWPACPQRTAFSSKTSVFAGTSASDASGHHRHRSLFAAGGDLCPPPEAFPARSRPAPGFDRRNTAL